MSQVVPILVFVAAIVVSRAAERGGLADSKGAQLGWFVYALFLLPVAAVHLAVRLSRREPSPPSPEAAANSADERMPG